MPAHSVSCPVFYLRITRDLACQLSWVSRYQTGICQVTCFSSWARSWNSPGRDLQVEQVLWRCGWITRNKITSHSLVPLTRCFWIIVSFDPYINLVSWSYQCIPILQMYKLRPEKLSDLCRVRHPNSCQSKNLNSGQWTSNPGPGTELTQETFSPLIIPTTS